MVLRRKKVAMFSGKCRGAMHPLLALPELANPRGLIGAADLARVLRAVEKSKVRSRKESNGRLCRVSGLHLCLWLAL